MKLLSHGIDANKPGLHGKRLAAGIGICNTWFAILGMIMRKARQ